MTTKSHVSLEQHLCLICGTPFDTGNILLDRRLRPSMEKYTTTGWGLCKKDQEMSDDGFVAFVECDPHRSQWLPDGTLKPEGAFRTGRVAHMKREACATVFSKRVKTSDAFVFVEPGIIKYLESITPGHEGDAAHDVG